MSSWIPIDENSDFSLQNLPYGVFSTEELDKRIGVAVGDFILDLKFLAQEKVFDDLGFDVTVLQKADLNAYANLGKGVHREVRQKLQQLLARDTSKGSVLRDNVSRRAAALVPYKDALLHLPVVVGEYTDFFVGPYHAENCADIVKQGATIEDVCPSFYHLPAAYHSRASSVVVSGTPIRRPKGQYAVDGKVVAGVCQRLDFEVEFAAVIGRGNEMGTAIDVNQAEEHIFGVVLLNDWSVRDIFWWESRPLGAFAGKNFATSISPWIVPLEALEPFRTTPKHPRDLLPYLTETRKDSAFDIPVQVTMTIDSKRYRVSDCNTNNVVFSFAQMVAHHTRGGCPLRTGDLLATGTVSGATLRELGCFLEAEATKYGRSAIKLTNEAGSETDVTRRYLLDEDILEFNAHAQSLKGSGVGFGGCAGKILPAN